MKNKYKSTRGDKRIMLIASIIYFLLGCIILFLSIMNISSNFKSWESTKGEIISAKVIDESFRGGWDRKLVARFTPLISYSYFVKGKEYKSEQFSNKKVWFSYKAQVDDLIRKFPANTKIEVHYSPNNPQESILKFSEVSSKDIIIGLASGIVMLVGAIIMGIPAIKDYFNIGK